MSEYLKEIFIEETREHLEILNSSLLELEKNMGDKDILNEIFRVAHSIKGSANLMTFTKITNLTHGMEDVLQDVRDGKLKVDTKLIELLFICHDFLENYLGCVVRTGNEGETKCDNIMNKLHEIIREKSSRYQIEQNKSLDGNVEIDDLILNQEQQDDISQADKEGFSTYKITVTLEDDCAFRSIRALMIYEELERHAKIIKARPDVEGIKKGSLDFQDCTIKVVITTQEPIEVLTKELDCGFDIEAIDLQTIQASPNSGLLYGPLRLAWSNRKNNLIDPNQEIVEEIVDEIIEGNRDNLIEVDQEFSQDIISEIKEYIENIEMSCLTLETEQDNTDSLYSLFRAFHTTKGLAGFIGKQLIQEVAYHTEGLMDGCRKGRVRVNKIIVDLILNSSEYIKKLCNQPYLENDQKFLHLMDRHVQALKNKTKNLYVVGEHQELEGTPPKKIGEILIEQGKVSQEEMEEILVKQRECYPNLKLGQVVVKEKKVEAKDIIQTLRIQEEDKAENRNSTPCDSGYIRVPIHKIDNLVDMMGELLIIESLMEQEAYIFSDSNNKFINNLLRMTRIMKDVQNLSMSLRMVSLKSTFQKIARIGRDTAKELNKKVNIEIIGEETEIDRGVTEKIVDPLMHLMRNSISHGIEDESVRIEKGKPAQGQVIIQAYSKRGNVYIEIKDDGGGMSLEKIYQKAKENKLIDPSLNYRDDEIIDFIFLPGFSTAETVNSISGRGVGLDVVRTEISKLGGKIEINNRPGEGCAFILKIPINLAIMNGTIVDILGNHYIIPTLNIKEIVQPGEGQWVSVKGKTTMIKVREDIIPLIPLAEEFGYKQQNSKQDLIIVIELEQKLKALPVRSILGRREIVVKSLGKEFSNLKFLSGASILGDGKVSLILDIETLFKMEEGM